MTGWRDMELGAPEVARLGMARLNSARAAMLGTLRRDGSPRISPIEPYIAQGQLLIGAMAWSKKADDLRRDPRYVLHRVVTGPDSGAGELKPYGSAVEAGQDLRGAAAEAWWSAWPQDKAIVYCLRIVQGCRRLGYRAWRDDGPSVVTPKRLQAGPAAPIRMARPHSEG